MINQIIYGVRLLKEKNDFSDSDKGFVKSLNIDFIHVNELKGY